MANQVFDDILAQRQLHPDLYSSKLPPMGMSDRMLSPRGIETIRPIVTASGNAINLSRDLQGQVIAVSNTAVLLAGSSFSRAVMITNPATGVNLSITDTVHASAAVIANGNTQLSPVDVANANTGHIFLKVTNITGNWDFIAQAYDSVTATWYDTQTLVAALAATGNYYYYLGSLGFASSLAFRWIQNVGATSITFSIVAISKYIEDFLPEGVDHTIYIGGKGVTPTSGYPILGGTEKSFVLSENLELWGVANNSVNVRVFGL